MSIENFIIKNIEVEEILGMKLASIYINFRGTKMPVAGPISELSPMHICYNSKRPKEMLPTDGVFQCHADINEYFGDMATIMYFLNNEPVLNDFSIVKAVEYICGEHIKNGSGKLIDSDLYSYVDLTIIAKNGIWTKFNNHTIEEAEAGNLWVELRNHILKTYEDYVYITEYDLSNPMQPKPYLVKYKDYR